MQLINIGFENFVSANRLISTLSYNSSPVKRLVHLGKENGNLIDATCGRKTQTVLIMDSGHIALSALSCENILSKLQEV